MTVEVMELAENDAAALLAFHASAPAIRTPGDALKLCRMLGFHPYAVELAGRLLQVFQMTPGLLIQRIGVARWSWRMGTAACVRSWRKVLAFCHASKRVFLCFGQLAAANASAGLLVCYAGEPMGTVLEGLDTLLERSLVRRPDSAAEYYTMHDLVFHYPRLLSQRTGARRYELCDATAPVSCDQCARC